MTVTKKQNIKRFRTGILFSTPTFLSGAGTVMNLAGSYYRFNSFETPEESDRKALENDFNMIGQDLKDAMKVSKP